VARWHGADGEVTALCGHKYGRLQAQIWYYFVLHACVDALTATGSGG